MRCRDDEDLALDRIDTERRRGPARPEPTHASAAVARPSVAELQAELAQLRERIGRYPEHFADQLHAARSARAEAQRVADEARARITELEQPARGVLRRRAADSPERAFERQRLKLAEEEIAAAAERERNLAGRLPDRTAWDAERRALRERAAELDAQFSSRRREHLRVALERPAPYLTASAGRSPRPAARSPHLAAGRHAHRGLPLRPRLTDARDALGAPGRHRERTHWQRARHDLQRAQRDLGRRIDRGPSHEL